MNAVRAALLGMIAMGCCVSAWGQQEKMLAKTPPMGWNSWNKYACNVTEEVIRQEADALVASGMRDAGYEYVLIDDCWQASRDKDGFIVADPKTFPSGIKALADYVHSKGMKFGVYSDAGSKTCAGRPGSLGHEYQDAQKYAEWGADYLKYDWCNTTTQDAKASYTLMRDALRATGRPIVFSLCDWGTAKPWLWAGEVGQLWRTNGDLLDKWEGTVEWGGMGLVNNLDKQVGLESYGGPGHWNDPDMLQVGVGGMTTTEYRSQFSLWAILAAPLIAGNDVAKMSPEIAAILLNREVIAVDQDALGRQGRRIRKVGELEVWSRELGDGSRAVVLFNRSAGAQKIAVKWTEIGYPAKLVAAVRDLWEKKELGKFSGEFEAEVGSHGVVMVTVRP